MTSRWLSGVVLTLIVCHASAQPPVEIRLWPKGAAGSENWSVPESLTGTDTGKRVVTNVTSGVIALFEAWRKAGKPAELHIYDGVSAGFGMNQRGRPVDTWTDRLHDWLVAGNMVGREEEGITQ